MPLYTYLCKRCFDTFEKRHPMSAVLTKCEKDGCNGKLERMVETETMQQKLPLIYANDKKKSRLAGEKLISDAKSDLKAAKDSLSGREWSGNE